MRTKPYTQQELSQMALENISKSRASVIRYRQRHDSEDYYKSTKTDSWDPKRVVVACGSLLPPFKAASGRQNSALRNGHPKLKEAYEIKGLQIGHPVPRQMKTKTDQPYWEPGHCAEPHAAHKLLNIMDRYNPIEINDIVFGYAFSVLNGTPIPYCNTCKLVFPQLL